MAKLTVSDAARVTGASRMLLYRYIKTGKLSRTPDGLLDTAELLRAGLTLQTSDVTTPVTMLHDVTSQPSPVVTPLVTPDVTALERLVTVLQRELDAAHAREQTAIAREEATREENALLLQMLQEMQHRYDRLLEAPRTNVTSLAQYTTPEAVSPSYVERGDMRRRIVALLQGCAEGLSPGQVRRQLASGKDLANTMKAMVRDGLLRRVGPGRYVVA